MRRINIFIIALMLTTSTWADSKTIYIYSGHGASKESILQTEHTIKEFSSGDYKIKKMNDRDILKGKWIKNAALFIMPGGADLPYVDKLNGKGNDLIRNYVNSGGSYLGVCAGGYYGSSSVEFDKGGPLEVVGTRELAFFPGKAVGPTLAAYDYKTNSGARAPLIEVSSDGQPINPVYLYFNGGGYFQDARKYPNVEVMADYQMEKGGKLPAIVFMTPLKGVVVLSGVHFEYSPELLDSKDSFLKDVIPALQKTGQDRVKLIQMILKKLNINLKKPGPKAL